MTEIDLSEREKDYLRNLIWSDTDCMSEPTEMLSVDELIDLYYKLGGTRDIDLKKTEDSR